MIAPAQTPLKVAVIGAGIGGLAAALALHKQGHDVHIYEKSHFKREVGAAISIASNVNNLLLNLGFNADEYRAVIEKKIIFAKPDGSTIWEWENAAEMAGKTPETRLIHRVDFHTGLKDTVEKNGMEISLGSAVESVDAERGQIKFVGGTSVSADVVIGADGLHSTVRRSIFPESEAERPFGNSVFRMMVPTERIAKDEKARRFVEKIGQINLWFGNDRCIVTYPCRNSELQNIALIFNESITDPVREDEDVRARMLDVAKGFHEDGQALFNLADDVFIWKLYDMPALESWTRGKTALLGDAAHPLQPFTAQGAAQAVEDTATLGEFIPLGTKPEDVPSRLALYFETRRERVEWIQAFGRMHGRVPTGQELKATINHFDFFEKVYKFDAIESARSVIESKSKEAGNESASGSRTIAVA